MVPMQTLTLWVLVVGKNQPLVGGAPDIEPGPLHAHAPGFTTAPCGKGYAPLVCHGASSATREGLISCVALHTPVDNSGIEPRTVEGLCLPQSAPNEQISYLVPCQVSLLRT